MPIPELLYRAGGLLAPFALLPVLLSSPRGRTRLFDRFGSWNVEPGDYTWFHGASMGELRGLLPLIDRFHATHPEERILVTATSASGLKLVNAEIATGRLLPFDHPLWIRRALSGVRIRQLVVAETEIWPALLSHLKAQGVRVSIVNGRISKYSFPRYRRFGSMLRRVLGNFDQILCAEARSASRFLELGAPESAVKVFGNTKYDTSPSLKDPEAQRALREALFADDAPIFTAGSLRPDEEEYFFPVIARMLREGSRLNVIVAPRHQEKFEWFAEKLAAAHIPFRRWSEKDAWGAREGWARCLLLDTFGMLEQCYGISSLAFIGATLIDIGGHNPLEAAAYGVPVMMGPYVSNVEEVCETLAARDGYYPVRDPAAIEALLRAAAARDPELATRGLRGKSVWEENSGTVTRVFEEIFSERLQWP